MEFRVFAYLREETLIERVTQLVNTFGIQPPWKGYKNFYQSPAQFLQILQTGIFTDWQENISGVPRPLASFLQVFDDEPNYRGYLRVELEIEPVFSPILKHPQAQKILAPAQLAALKKGYSEQIGHHGFMSAKASQGEIAKQGKYAIATLQSSIFDFDWSYTEQAKSYGRELNLTDPPRIREKQWQIPPRTSVSCIWA